MIRHALVILIVGIKTAKTCTKNNKKHNKNRKVFRRTSADLNKQTVLEGKVNLLFNVTMSDIPVIYVTAHRCTGGMKKKLDQRSGSHAIDIS